METGLTIGALSRRSGVAPWAVHFYEAEGLVDAKRAEAGQPRYPQDTL